MLETRVPKPPDDKPLTKREILSHLASIYDPLGVISPTTVKGKQMYRDACEETKGWNTEVSDQVKREWNKWSNQLKTVRVPRSVARGVGPVQALHLHVFADASNIACSAVTIALVEGDTGVVKGLLKSKSRISKRDTSIARLELVGGQMAANRVRNLQNTLKRWPIVTTTVWMHGMVALYWVRKLGKPWKVFVTNRVRKTAEITQETGIEWRYCPTGRNLADLGSRGASIEKMQRGQRFEGPEWLLKEEEWPEKKRNKSVSEEHRPEKEEMLYSAEKERDAWDKHNSLTKRHKTKIITRPLTTEELSYARDQWIRKEQAGVQPDIKSPGWKLVIEENTGIFKWLPADVH